MIHTYNLSIGRLRGERQGRYCASPLPPHIELAQMMRDISKVYYDSDIRLIMLGFENQTKTDNEMVFRVMAYDVAQYLRQVREKRSEKSGIKKIRARCYMRIVFWL